MRIRIGVIITTLVGAACLVLLPPIFAQVGQVDGTTQCCAVDAH